MPDQQLRQQLEAIYRAAIDAIQPDRAVRCGLDDASLNFDQPIYLLAIGKAAETMLGSALSWCASHGITPVGGICISHSDVRAALPNIFDVARGDHPQPGDGSFAAAELLRDYVARRVDRRAQIVVLLSGGTSALIGAPAGALTSDGYRDCCALLLRSGLDIHAHNALRRQLSMWGNGRLGEALLHAGASVRVLAISDVPGDALESIGSAPCITTPASPDESDAIVDATALDAAERELLRVSLRIANAQRAAEFPAIPHTVISSNRIAREAVVVAAAEMGIRAALMPEVLVGDAHLCGERIARELVSLLASAHEPLLCCWGGEPIVTLPAHAPPGGRMQALALAAAGTLHSHGDVASGITLLAAGTDGRDGATDAAGAVVDAQTWEAVCAAGGDPRALLDAHDSHSALRLSESLIPQFMSGTNVNDLVIALLHDPITPTAMPHHGLRCR